MKRIPIERREEAIPEGYVKVVRCGECKYYDKGLCCKGIYDIDDSFDIPKILKAFSHFYPFAVFEDDYCSRGVRKEGTK